MMKLFLFDIDGTLLIGRSNLYRDPLNRAGREVFHPDFSVDLLNRLGSIDAFIIEEAVETVGQTLTTETLAEFQGRYFDYLTIAAKTATRLPGAAEILDWLESRSDVALGLVTGNYRESARIKLDGVGLRFDRFVIGGFGDKKVSRTALVQKAVEQAKKHFDTDFPANNVIVVGDTLKDIACARDNGCRVVAVASGWTSREELAAAEPDLLLNDLSESEKFCEFCFPAATGGVRIN